VGGCDFIFAQGKGPTAGAAASADATADLARAAIEKMCDERRGVRSGGHFFELLEEFERERPPAHVVVERDDATVVIELDHVAHALAAGSALHIAPDHDSTQPPLIVAVTDTHAIPEEMVGRLHDDHPASPWTPIQ
jgi:hypothetical protein